jgi:hypothetical protein
VNNTSRNVTPYFTGTTVSPPVGDGSYNFGAFTTGYTSGSGVLTRIQAQALIPPPGGRVVNFEISNTLQQGLAFTDSSYHHPGDTTGDHLYDGPYINRVGKIAVDVPDGDSDGISNSCDNCPNVSNANQADTDGDGLGDACDPDIDNDGVANASDNCPTVPNANQADVNHNGIGDACEDSDGDGVLDGLDNCPSISNATQADVDHDGVGDPCDPDDDNDGICDLGEPFPNGTPGTPAGGCVVGPSGGDNCALVPNPGQQDVNNNGVGDACEDSDGDGVLDGVDNCPVVANANQADVDADGVGDACDNCPLPNPSQADWNRDGMGDACQNSDADQAAFNDAEEVFVGTLPGTKCPVTTAPNDENPDAWPPDLNDDQKVGLADILSYVPVYLTTGPYPPYNKRFDLNADNKIGLADLLWFIPVYLSTCTP